MLREQRACWWTRRAHESSDSKGATRDHRCRPATMSQSSKRGQHATVVMRHHDQELFRSQRDGERVDIGSGVKISRRGAANSRDTRAQSQHQNKGRTRRHHADSPAGQPWPKRSAASWIHRRRSCRRSSSHQRIFPCHRALFTSGDEDASRRTGRCQKRYSIKTRTRQVVRVESVMVRSMRAMDC